MKRSVISVSLSERLARAREGKGPMILDGAVGTELDNRGVDTGSPVWSGLAPLDHPDLLGEIHREYVEAGAEVVITCTFRTTRRAFGKAGLVPGRWSEAARAAVSIARRSASGLAYVAGSVAPLEDCFEPGLAPSGPEAVGEHMLLCGELVRAGVDALWLETFGTLGEIEAAATAAVEAGREGDVPLVVSVTTNQSGRLISGEPLEGAISIARSKGAIAFCVNCIPPGHVEAVLPALQAASDLPVGVYANLGKADPNQDWQGDANVTPEDYAYKAADWLDAGVCMVGGCCGSSPAHIRELARL